MSKVTIYQCSTATMGLHHLDPVLIALIAVSVSSAILLIVGHNNFQRIRHLSIIDKRFPSLVQARVRIAIVVLLILLPAHYTNTMWTNTHHDTAVAARLHLVRLMFSRAVLPALSYALNLIECIRLWVIYYELRLLVSLQNEEWGTKITSTFHLKDYFLKNRKTMGSVRWISKRVFWLWLSMSALSGTLLFYAVDSEVSPYWMTSLRMMQTVMLLGPLVFVAFIWRKAPRKPRDHMMLDKEFRMLCGLLLVAVFGWLCTAASTALESEAVTLSLVGLSFIFSVSAPSILSTGWIPYLVEKNPRSKVLGRSRSLILKEGLFKARQMTADGKRMVSMEQELNALYQDEEKMKALMGNMVRDFTMESFLCFVESAQFRNYVIDVIHDQNADFDDEDVVKRRIKFYAHCPQSSIVFNHQLPMGQGDLAMLQREIMLAIQEEEEEEEQAVEEQGDQAAEEQQNDEMETPVPMEKNENVEDAAGDRSAINDENDLTLSEADRRHFKQSAHLLFQKYIAVKSALEINISYEMRQYFTALDAMDYDMLSPTQWVKLYDGILKSTEVYILQSYDRMIERLHRAEQLKQKRRGK